LASGAGKRRPGGDGQSYGRARRGLHAARRKQPADHHVFVRPDTMRPHQRRAGERVQPRDDRRGSSASPVPWRSRRLLNTLAPDGDGVPR